MSKLEPSHELEIGNSPEEYAKYVRILVREAKEYARSSRVSWRKFSTILHLGTVCLSVLATIMFGLADRNLFTNIGLVASSLTAIGSSFESYFNFRSRWILAEEALAEWHLIEDDLMSYMRLHEASDLQLNDLKEFDRRRAEVWVKLSREWINHRRAFDRATGGSAQLEFPNQQ